jgi:hypothetical protein
MSKTVEEMARELKWALKYIHFLERRLSEEMCAPISSIDRVTEIETLLAEMEK